MFKLNLLLTEVQVALELKISPFPKHFAQNTDFGNKNKTYPPVTRG